MEEEDNQGRYAGRLARGEEVIDDEEHINKIVDLTYPIDHRKERRKAPPPEQKGLPRIITED